MRDYGLQPTPYDPRDFALGAIVRLPDLNTIPESFEIPTRVKDQKDSDFCSAYMSCTMSEPQEGMVFEPSYSFAVSKEISGNKDGWGQNLRDALKAHLRGALPEDESPYSIESKTKDFLRDIDNWDVPESMTQPYRKKSFFKVTGQYDHFDNARAALFHFKSPIGTGVRFGWPIDKIVFDNVPDKGFGHAMAVVGFSHIEGEPVLTLQNSYGNVGKDGKHYITRDVYNHFAEKYGHYMFTDIDPNEMKSGILYWIKNLWAIFWLQFSR